MIITSICIVLISAVVIYFIYKRITSDTKIQNAEKKVQTTLEETATKTQDILTKAHAEAQEILSKSRLSIEEEIKTRRQSITQIENRLMQKEKHLDTKENQLVEKENNLEAEVEKVKNLKKKQESIINELLTTLENVAGLSKEEAKNILLTNVERETRKRAGLMIKKIEEQTQKVANRKAVEIITDAIQRTAIDHVAPTTTSVIQLPDDEMKGRIIGREGRNIRTFEAITGVDVIIDDTPCAVILSSFDPIRREVAKIGLKKLVEDGRIHPARVEEMVEKAKKELLAFIIQKGEQVADEFNMEIHPRLIELLGKLYFRTSYGQNILAHSMECAYIAGIIAQELGVNVKLAKRGALLHDIGKAIDFEQEGTHCKLGKEICEKYKESDEIINCIMSHHDDEAPQTIEAIIVKIADGISASRPGARRESMETYIKRLERLEGIAKEFEGVDKAYAIQAGREIRVMVKPDEVNDPAAHKMALDMAKKIESEVDYPGEVKVSIIRETRATGIAK
ncbi:ribonuclease Y [Candidatus Margulisiibacteriota bacterium]